MSAIVFTFEAAKRAGIVVIEGGRGTQAVHDSVVAMRAARRSGTANTKSKAQVALSGAKPWRQKGTGRARAGYKSSPVWVGGGVVFGPKPRDYTKKVGKAVRRLAFSKALSARIATGDVLTVGAFEVAGPKTRDFVSLLQSVTHEAKVLVISGRFCESTYLAARNVRAALLMTASEVNTEDLLGFRKIIVTDSALGYIAKRTSKK